MPLEGTTIDSIDGKKPVRVFLPISGQADRYRSNSIFQRSSGSDFNLLFKHGVLPALSLDLGQTCLVSIDQGASTITIEAKIKEIIGDQALSLVVNSLISHDQLREFFRVDATAAITCRSLIPLLNPKEEEQENLWRLKGTTVDISGSGVRAIFSELPPWDQQMYLDITLPGYNEQITSIVACKRRERQLDAAKYEVAFEFVDISVEDRDKIIGCCLSIQRKLLRLKVQVKD